MLTANETPPKKKPFINLKYEFMQFRHKIVQVREW